MRISCAMPRASLRSVFTFIAPSAALRCRVSIRIAASPAAVSPACNHRDSGPASRPIRVNLRPLSANHATSASGSLATFASRIIFPVSSTTHNTALFQRHVHCGKIVHGCSFLMLGADPFGPRHTITVRDSHPPPVARYRGWPHYRI